MELSIPDRAVFGRVMTGELQVSRGEFSNKVDIFPANSRAFAWDKYSCSFMYRHSHTCSTVNLKYSQRSSVTVNSIESSSSVSYTGDPGFKFWPRVQLSGVVFELIIAVDLRLRVFQDVTRIVRDEFCREI